MSSWPWTKYEAVRNIWSINFKIKEIKVLLWSNQTWRLAVTSYHHNNTDNKGGQHWELQSSAVTIGKSEREFRFFSDSEFLLGYWRKRQFGYLLFEIWSNVDNYGQYDRFWSIWLKIIPISVDVFLHMKITKANRTRKKLGSDVTDFLDRDVRDIASHLCAECVRTDFFDVSYPE